MNRGDRLGRLADRMRNSRVLMVPELQDDLRFCLEELARLDELRDQLRDTRTKLELLQYLLSQLRQTVSG